MNTHFLTWGSSAIFPEMKEALFQVFEHTAMASSPFPVLLVASGWTFGRLERLKISLDFWKVEAVVCVCLDMSCGCWTDVCEWWKEDRESGRVGWKLCERGGRSSRWCTVCITRKQGVVWLRSPFLCFLTSKTEALLPCVCCECEMGSTEWV